MIFQRIHAKQALTLIQKSIHLLYELSRFLVHRVIDGRTTQMASSLTYTTLLSIVPLFTVILAVFTVFPQFTELQDRLNEQLVTSFLPKEIAEQIMGYIHQFVANAAEIKTISGVVLVVMAISLMYTIDSALNEIWRVTAVRSWPQRVMVYWVVLTLGPILLATSVWLANHFGQDPEHWLHNVPSIVVWFLSWLPLLLTTLVFACIFIFVPNCYIHWKDAVIGGLFVACLLEILRVALTSYLGSVDTYKNLYGTFAILPIFLLWMYSCWLVILLGAILTAALPLIRMGRWEVDREAGAEFIDAIELLKLLVRERGAVPPGVKINQLSQELRLSYDELREVLEVLLQLGYVAKIGTGFKERWALVCAPETASIGPIVDTLLIHREHRAVLDSPALVDAVARVWLNREDMSLLEALQVQPISDERAINVVEEP